MGQVNRQSESGPKQRENGVRPSSGGQQLKAEKLLISNDFSRKATAGEPVANRHLGGGRGAVVKPSLLLFQWVTDHTKSRWMLPGESWASPIAAFLAGAGRSTAWPDPGAHCVCPRIPRIGTEGGAFAVSAANACLQRGGVRPNARTSRTGEASTRGRGACRDRRRERGRPSPAGVSDARRACRPRPGSRARHAPPRGGQARYSCPGLASASRS